MNNKKIALTVTAFIIVFMLIVLIIGISGHIPFIGKGLMLIFAVTLIIFVLIFFIIIARRKK